jgi:hypothetical protein
MQIVSTDTNALCAGVCGWAILRAVGCDDWLVEQSEFELAVPILNSLTTAVCLVGQHYDERGL